MSAGSVIGRRTAFGAAATVPPPTADSPADPTVNAKRATPAPRGASTPTSRAWSTSRGSIRSTSSETHAHSVSVVVSAPRNRRRRTGRVSALRAASTTRIRSVHRMVTSSQRARNPDRGADTVGARGRVMAVVHRIVVRQGRKVQELQDGAPSLERPPDFRDRVLRARDGLTYATALRPPRGSGPRPSRCRTCHRPPRTLEERRRTLNVRSNTGRCSSVNPRSSSSSPRCIA